MNMRSSLPSLPLDTLSVFRHRRPLAQTARRIASGQLTIGFLGGSITQDNDHNWPAPLARWFAQTFPETRIVTENAGMGATGSNSACMRAQREIIGRGCDLTFVEYAVNDNGAPSERRNRTREGLLRKLLAAGQEVVLVYVYCREMYDEMVAGKVPPSIAEFERLAEHYGLGSVWAGLHAFRAVQTGAMKWDEWLPDGLHPNYGGSACYAEAVARFMEAELLGSPEAREPFPAPEPELPAPLFPHHWQNMTLLPLTEVHTSGPWVLRRVQNHLHTGQVLESHTVGAGVRFDFTGRGLALAFEYGKYSSEIRYRIDGGDWMSTCRERPDWGGNAGMVQPCIISDELPEGAHTFEMEIIHGNRPDCMGTECRLGLIGVLA